jgi:RecB family exonuclease
MAIPNDFQFSQASLQDFTDCRRRFYYRYVQRLAWPALEAEPALANEHWMQQGTDFHQLVHRYILGIPVERLTQSARGNLAVWWENFLSQVPFEQEAKLFPERMLAAELDGRRLVAKIDLIAVNPDGSIDIFDWKTSRKALRREVMADKLQTKVYPFVISQGGSLFGEEPVAPEKIRMTYWYVSRPAQPEVFDYSAARLAADREALKQIIDEVAGLDGIEQFPLTGDDKRCRFCVYRSLCERGETAGNFEEEADFEADEDFDLDFDLIEEIEF